MLAALALVAAAEEPRTVVLEAPEDLGGSALDGLDEDARQTSEDATLPLELPRPPVRGRYGARPVLEGSLLAGGERTYWAMRVGIDLSHRYWRLTDRTVQLVGQTSLRATAPIGAATGRRFELNSTVAPWIGPVGLRIGPVVRSDRVRWRTPELELVDTLAVGGRADLALELGAWRAFGGIEITWLVAGNRPPADPATAILPVVGDETAYRLGVGRQGRRLLTALRGNWRETAIGAEIDVGLQFGLRVF